MKNILDSIIKLLQIIATSATVIIYDRILNGEAFQQYRDEARNGGRPLVA